MANPKKETGKRDIIRNTTKVIGMATLCLAVYSFSFELDDDELSLFGIPLSGWDSSEWKLD